MIHMFWEDCNKPSFHKHICKPKSLMYLDVKNVIYSHVAKIVWSYMEQDKQKFNKIKQTLVNNMKRFQFVYSRVYPEVYCFVEKRGIELRNNFHLKFKDWKGRKKYSQVVRKLFLNKQRFATTTCRHTTKRLVTDVEFEAEKKLVEEQKQRDGREKTKR